MTIFDYAPDYYKVFTDEAGHKWGNVSYYYGIRNAWICLDAPAADAEELYPDGLPIRGVSEDEIPQENSSDELIEPKTQEDHTILIITLIVAAVAAVTAVFLILIKKSAKRNP